MCKPIKALGVLKIELNTYIITYVCGFIHICIGVLVQLT